MAEKKKRKVQMSADRLKMLRKSKRVAGKSKSDLKTRREQNKGVKDGTIRLGKNGKSYNVWDAKSGRWLKGQVKAQDAEKKAIRDALNAHRKKQSDKAYLAARRKPSAKSWHMRNQPGHKHLNRKHGSNTKSGYGWHGTSEYKQKKR